MILLLYIAFFNVIMRIIEKCRKEKRRKLHISFENRIDRMKQTCKERK